MKVIEYQDVVEKTDQTVAENGHSVRTFGLAGEIGSLLAELKKDIREGRALANTASHVAEEIGDILWYITALAIHTNLKLGKDILFQNLVKITNPGLRTTTGRAPLKRANAKATREVELALKRMRGSKVVTFGRYQEIAVKTSRFKRLEPLLPYIVRMWSHSSELLEALEQEVLGNNARKNLDLGDILGDLTWYLANIAAVYGLDFDEVAAQNASKVLSRWPKDDKRPTPLFDKKAPDLERFPRHMDVSIIPKNDRVSVMMINGVLIGDPLTDNSWEPDGYRFHDTIHLAHAAVLGWSPVLRRMLNRKRKYDRRIDEVEDGARAAIVEEAVAKLIHSYSKSIDPEKLLDDQNSVSFEILKQVKILTEGLEVDKCHYWEWEKAILAGQHIFNKLRKHEKGTIHIDLHNRSIKYSTKRVSIN